MKRDIVITEDTSGWEQTFEYPESETVDVNDGWHSQQPYPVDQNGKFIEGSVPDPDYGRKPEVEKPEETESVQSVELKLAFEW